MTEFHFESDVVALPHGGLEQDAIGVLRNPVVTEA